MKYSTKEHIQKITAWHFIGYGLSICFLSFMLFKSIAKIEFIASPAIIIMLIFPVFFLFLLGHTVFYFVKHRRKVEEIGLSEFEINENFFRYINSNKEQIFNSENLPKSMKRNFKSFIIETKDEIITILFSDYVIENDEINDLKVKFDLLKNHLFNK